MRKTLLALALLALPFAATAQTKIAATPPMGWNSWNHFAKQGHDKDVRAPPTPSSPPACGSRLHLRQHRRHLEGKRDAQGNIHANSKFPDMKALADYVHSKGLKIGIYSWPGPRTCGGYSAATGTKSRMRRPTQTGASTTSSTTSAATARSCRRGAPATRSSTP